jgi:hypothetical protein
MTSRAKRFEYSTVSSGTLAIADGAEGAVEGRVRDSGWKPPVFF